MQTQNTTAPEVKPADIAALAAQLTEADIAAILRAKAPESISGCLVTHVCFNAYSFGTNVVLHALGTNTSGNTFAEAAERITRQIGDAATLAAEKRAQAATLIAEATRLESAA